MATLPLAGGAGGTPFRGGGEGTGLAAVGGAIRGGRPGADGAGGACIGDCGCVGNVIGGGTLCTRRGSDGEDELCDGADVAGSCSIISSMSG